LQDIFLLNVREGMKTGFYIFIAAIFLSCAAKPRFQTNDQGELPSDKIEAVSKDIDVDPEPVGGIEAIQEVLREPEEVIKGSKEGWVMVEVMISASGRVMSTKIAQSSGFAGMDSEALMAVARVPWKPARKRGAPITATVRVPVKFEKN